MCGIVAFSGSHLPERLGLALQQIRHRGPDDSGTYHDVQAGIGLGHARLSIIDLSPLGHQPMVDPSGMVRIVFNGEIYDYRDHRAELERRGHSFRGHSDTEVLLHMYLEFGDAMLPMLNGIFAFALWDERTSRMLIARDALGVKPLYFAETSQGVALCSEIKGLLKLVPEARELDCVSIDRYLTYLWCPGPGTPLRQVRKLGPGEAIEVRRGSITKHWTWYQLPVFRGIRPKLSGSMAVDAATRSIRSAVHRQMVADVPVGAFLSGGLDSSAVVTFARELNPSIRCFTIEAVGGHDEGETDDLPYARRVAAHLGVPLDVVRVESGSMASDLEMMVRQLDEPLADPAPLNVFYISKLAREQGMKVLLSGAGGDDIFTGYRRHFALQTERAWSWLPAIARGGLEQLTGRLDHRRPQFRRLAKYFRGASRSGDERIAAYYEWVDRRDLVPIYSPSFLERCAGQRTDRPIADFLRPLPQSVDRLDRMLAVDQRFFLADHNLIYTDKMSMAVGVEARVPLLDLELIDVASSIALSDRQRGRVGKAVFKRAMEPYLPHSVIYRPKSGFTAPLRRWMRHELRDLVHDYLGPESISRRDLFDFKAVRALVEGNNAGRSDAGYSIFGLLCLEIWCREFIDTA